MKEMRDVSGQSPESITDVVPSMDLETARNILLSVVNLDDSLLDEGQLDRVGQYSAQEVGRATALVCSDLTETKQTEWDDISLHSVFKHRTLVKRVGKGSLELDLQYRLSEGDNWTPHSVELHYRSYGTDENLAETYESVLEIGFQKLLESDEDFDDEISLDDLPEESQDLYKNLRDIEAKCYLDPDGFMSSFTRFKDETADEVRYEDMGMTTGLKEEFDLEKYKFVFKGTRWIFANLLSWDTDYINPEDLPSSVKTIKGVDKQ